MEKVLKRKFGTTDKYVLSLLMVCLISSVAYADVYLFILIGTSLLAVLQVFIETKSLKFIHTELLKKKFLIYTLIVIPILEEYIFRYLTYHLLQLQGTPNHFFVVISSLTFTFIHYYKLKEKSFYKFILGLILAIVFLWTENLFITIYIHVTFNVLVYLIKYTEFYRGFE
ncbi:CPBP family intramembrane glutamic endopeptidase [Fervidibacillus albus]|uniref:CPBP family intramembrane metalloprotease n=1 Tax=Fervidibacillus albus TaxID=2980026 RepID=A0A9E8LX50_9BACI|nr:CPBP family intramembrane glutamic endopeptidase [Fervidibacillus albus]WAA11333.1 CPBP family intramembrane metalloprotease [Fervidibacillus albus]